MSRHTISHDHARCCCVTSFCNLHWQPPKSHICNEKSSSYELYWLPADPTSGCPVDERNPRAVMIGAVTDEVPRVLSARGVPQRLWQVMTTEMLHDSPPTTCFFGLMVIPLCLALPCAIANCLRLRSWNSFMYSTVEKYRESFKELGIDLVWYPVWLPSSSNHHEEDQGLYRRTSENMVVDKRSSSCYKQCSEYARFDDKGGPTLRFIFLN